MSISLHHIKQVSLNVDDIDVAEKFYEHTLGLRKLYRFGSLVFFESGCLRLFITQETSKDAKTPFTPSSSILYFSVPDIGASYRQFVDVGVTIVDKPHLVSPMLDHDLWMFFFKDPAGNLLGVMHEAPRGWKPHIEA